MKPILKYLLTAFTAMMLFSCSHELRIPQNSACYWQPAVKLSQQELDFINEQQVTTIYLHIFDVRHSPEQPGMKVENEIQFIDTFPKSVEVVPVVMLTSGVVNAKKDMNLLADTIVNRATMLMEQHGYDTPREIQIDYDWSAQDQKEYFELLKAVNKRMSSRRGHQTSATIRLHHLSMTPPPVDYVLMMLYSNRAEMPMDGSDVFNTDLIRQHLLDLKKYEKPLATVLPFYGYDLVYNNDGQFRNVVKDVCLSDTTLFRPLGNGEYLSKEYQPVKLACDPNFLLGRLFPGDIVMHKQPTAGMLDSVASLISRVRPGDRGNIVMYQLNQQCIHNYTPAEFKKILLGGSLVHNDTVEWD